jgi:hypothetical protein
VTAAGWWALGLTIWSWVILAAAAALAWRWAVRTHTLYRAMRADYEAGRPAAPAPELVAALEHHHHAAPRPRIRIPRPRLPHPRRDPFSDLPAPGDGPWIYSEIIPGALDEIEAVAPPQVQGCIRCGQKVCPRCQGCSCAMARCECTKITAIGPGR